MVCQESQGSSKIKSISYSIDGGVKEGILSSHNHEPINDGFCHLPIYLVEASEIVIVDYEIPSSNEPPTVLTVTCENGGKTIIKIRCCKNLYIK